MAEQLLRQKQWLLLVKYPFRIGSLCSIIIWWLFSLIIHKMTIMKLSFALGLLANIALVQTAAGQPVCTTTGVSAAYAKIELFELTVGA